MVENHYPGSIAGEDNVDDPIGVHQPELNRKELAAAKMLQEMLGGPTKVPLEKCKECVHAIVLATAAGAVDPRVVPNSMKGD